MFPALAVLLAATPDATLLDRLAAHARQLEQLERNSDVTMAVTANELDGDGQPTKTKHRVMRVHERAGESTVEVLEAKEDGKDVTAEAKAKAAEKARQKRDDDEESLSTMLPFHPDAQAKYAFALLQPPSDRRLVRIGFSPKGDKTPELMMGDATVDPETGEVLALSMRPSKLPPLVDHLTFEAELKAESPVGHALSRLELKGEAGVLFVKKRFRVVTTFSDYRAAK